MIKHISFFTFFLFSLISFSQCDVNENQAPFLADPVGAYNMQLIEGVISLEPLDANFDTLTAFPSAIEGQLYEAVVGVRIPNDTSFVYELTPGEPQLFENVQINSISINSVEISESTSGALDLPPGFSWDCVGGTTTPSECTWAGGDYGCISFGFDAEVPTGFSGAHRINVLLDVSATYELFPGVPIPIDITVDDLLNYYVLVIEEGDNTDISEVIDSRIFSLISVSPNPAQDFITFKYGNSDISPVEFKVYDILGNLVMSKSCDSMFGYNETTLETKELISGIYTISLSNNLENIISRIIIK
tara:strand:- start:1013 stop:1921 length:909 start_codon:yes stop_codon:yes gene_type:complete